MSSGACTTCRWIDCSVDPGETNALSAANPEIFKSMQEEYRSYSEKVGVIELGPEDSAFKQLFKNVAMKALHKYWPYALGAILASAAVLYLILRMGSGLVRRAASFLI